MYICEICKAHFNDIKSFSNHLRFVEHIKVKDYYDKYLKREGEGVCTCGKPTKFKCLEIGYFNHCSSKCSNSDISVKKKQQETTLSHYGVLHPAQNKTIIERMQSTCMTKYGALNGHGEEQKEKMKQDCLDKYGVEHSWQREDVKIKSKESKLLKYGDENFTNHEKCVETLQSKYGVVNCGQLEESKRKVKLTKEVRYGDCNYNNATKMRNTKITKIQQFMIDNNCLLVSDLVDIYGSGWRNAKVADIIIYNDVAFVKQIDLDKIIKYSTSITPNSGMSHKEKALVDYIKTLYCGIVLENRRSIISPQELDIYLPELKLAIEFNGTHWHSIEMGTPKDYHLDKSLKCRDLGIRLIHIYEFEDFEEQKRLLGNLILGSDFYPKNDFNKNNLIDTIPAAEIIYYKEYTLYGAGKLY
ncbi:MAG: hypothetical protein IJZ79_03760 [Bacilli bacterium]|nr:hypothetical protein [Bacilli bacterium]MBQ8218846.1 hypothetical protein [Bacilli bacterium]